MQPYLAPRSTVARYKAPKLDPCSMGSSRVIWLKQDESSPFNAAMDPSEELPVVGR